MKRLFLTLALVLSVLSVMAADILPISNAFKGGNASSLSGSMDKEVDMALPGSSKSRQDSQSSTMLIKKKMASLLPNCLLHPVNIA